MSESGKILKIDLGKLGGNLDPVSQRNDASWNLISNIGGKLFALKNKGTIQPELANDFVEAEKGKCFDITLKEGLTFHDGSPLTAYDVEFSLKRASKLSKGYELQEILDVKKIKALDEKTVRVCGKRASDLILFSLTLPNMSIVSPKHVYREKTGFKTKLPVLSGPYKIVSKANKKIVLQKHLTHPFIKSHKKAPHEIVVFHEEGKESLNSNDRLYEGETNFLRSNGDSFKHFIESNDKKDFQSLNLVKNQLFFVAINNAKNSRMKDKEIRNAFAAIVKEWSRQEHLKNRDRVEASQFFPEGYLGSLENVKKYESSQFSKVYEELRKNPIKLKWVIDPKHKGTVNSDTSNFIKEHGFLKEHGFEVKIIYLSRLQRHRRTKSGKGYDCMFYNIPFIPGDPTTVFRVDLDDKYVPMYDPKGVIKKMNEQSKILNTLNKRVAVAQKFSKHIIDNSIVVPLFYTGIVYWSTKDFNLKNMNPYSTTLYFWEIEQA